MAGERATTAPGAILLYDGDCGFCSRSVRFVHRRDPRGRFHFARLQSDLGRHLATQHGVDPDRLDTMVLIQDGRAHVRSGAALRVAKGLRWPWPLAAALLAVPPFLRDAAYSAVARRRHKLAGEACPLPDESLRRRMLD